MVCNLPSLNYSLSPVSSADNNEPPCYSFFIKNRISELAQIIEDNHRLISDAMRHYWWSKEWASEFSQWHYRHL